MEIGIVLPDATSALRLVQPLAATFGAAAVTLHHGGREIRVQAGRTPSQAIAAVLATVTRWLDEGGVRFAQIRLGKRAYTLAGEDRPYGPGDLR